MLAKASSITSRLRETQLKEIVISNQNNANKLVLEFQKEIIEKNRKAYSIQMNLSSLTSLQVTEIIGPESYLIRYDEPDYCSVECNLNGDDNIS